MPDWDHLLNRLRQVCGAIAVLSAARAAVAGTIDPSEDAALPSPESGRPGR